MTDQRTAIDFGEILQRIVEFEPRAKKRRPKQYLGMTTPRRELLKVSPSQGVST